MVRDGRNVVFVVGDDGRASARPVTLGWQEPGWIEVTDGLLASEHIITEGAALLSNGSALDLTAATP